MGCFLLLHSGYWYDGAQILARAGQPAASQALGVTGWGALGEIVVCGGAISVVPVAL